MAVKAADLLKMKMNVPSTDKQRKIVACVKSFDDVIRTHEELLIRWERIKKDYYKKCLFRRNYGIKRLFD